VWFTKASCNLTHNKNNIQKKKEKKSSGIRIVWVDTILISELKKWIGASLKVPSHNRHSLRVERLVAHYRLVLFE